MLEKEKHPRVLLQEEKDEDDQRAIRDRHGEMIFIPSTHYSRQLTERYLRILAKTKPNERPHHT